jgi:YD repeat-containing protein
MTYTQKGEDDLTYEYLYSDSGLVLALASPGASTPTMSFTYDSDERIVSIETFADVEVYEYGDDYVIGTSTDYVETYQLDALGYPLSVKTTSLTDGSLVSTLTFHYENCRLVSSTLADPSGVINPNLSSVDIRYDEAGHMISRNTGNGRVSTYDYSCW